MLEKIYQNKKNNNIFNYLFNFNKNKFYIILYNNNNLKNNFYSKKKTKSNN